MNLRVSDAKREDGFTLIELLVVVIIIGILAAIAIPVFLNQRENARDSAVQSTLRSAATYQEIVFTEDEEYTDDVSVLEGEGFRSGENVEVAAETGTTTEGVDVYCIEAVHSGDGDLATADAGRIWALTIDPEEPGSGAPVQDEGCATDGTFSS